ncbi:MAG TPA: AraC family transcriptional regulator [Clostridiales bacterium]|nr:AraC family transcriptional regulator [Clostridiales bacterium]
MVRARYILQNSLTIDKLITFYYMELTSKFMTRGERHDFWEFVYVDKGEIEILTDSKQYELNQGDIIFYKPNEFHAGRAKNNTNPNLIIISFECSAPCMEFFEGKTFRLDEEERKILSRLIKEGVGAFDPPVDSPNMRLPRRRQNAPFGSEQLIKNHLEILLILMIRKGDKRQENERLQTITSENREEDLTAQIKEYMKSCICENLTPEQLCTAFAISRTQLMTMFKAKTGLGVKEYFNKLKIEKAKEMIRSGQYNFSQIAGYLSYNSVHYFSKQFKFITQMTPTEYARSVKSR